MEKARNEFEIMNNSHVLYIMLAKPELALLVERNLDKVLYDDDAGTFYLSSAGMIVTIVKALVFGKPSYRATFLLSRNE